MVLRHFKISNDWKHIVAIYVVPIYTFEVILVRKLEVDLI
jgi:hypothetical protein